MKITIDGQPLEVEPGTTILAAARSLGIDIPTLCFLEGVEPQTSCFMCVVQIDGVESLQPSCAAPVAEGMVIHTDNDVVYKARRTAMELLLSDHSGCCVARCSMGCPADLDIPGFIAEMKAGNMRKSIAVVKDRLALPAVLGQICPEFCESPCGRKQIDESIAIRSLHRHVAEIDLDSDHPYLPKCKEPTGKKTAIVGAGPAGLTAAYYLLQEGIGCVLFDAAERPGGLLRHYPAEGLDQNTVDAEIAVIERLGAQFRMNWRLGADGNLDDLRKEFDAVLIAFGAWNEEPGDKRSVDLSLAESQGLKAGRRGIEIDPVTMETNLPGVFAAGEALTGKSFAVRAGDSGRTAAICIEQFLSSGRIVGAEKPFYFYSKPTPEETEKMYAGHEKKGRVETVAAGMSAADAVSEAARCLMCGCDKQDTCKMRVYASRYGASGNRFKGERRLLDPDDTHPDLVFEPGKCILCGLCVRIAKDLQEERGLCFTGRGFATRVAPPHADDFSRSVAKNPQRYADSCPTGALKMKEK
jgi:ferredoxin